MKKSHAQIWLLISAASVVTLAAIFRSPSSMDKAWLMGLSLQRMALAAFPLICLLLCLVMLGFLRFAPLQYKRITDWLHQRTKMYLPLSISVAGWLAVFLFAAWAYFRLVAAPNSAVLTPVFGNRLPALFAYLERAWPVFLFAGSCMVIWIFYAVKILRVPFFQGIPKLLLVGVGVLCGVATLFQWMVFVFQLRVFELIPGWYWPIILKPDFTRNAAVFAAFLAALLGLGFSIRRYPRAVGLHIALTGLIFIALQYAIGYLEGRGLASLNNRFFLSYHRIYIEEACNATISAREAVVRYEELFPSMFLQTKPPGVLWLSFQITNLANTPVLAPFLDQFKSIFTLSEYLPRMVSDSCRRSMALVSLVFPFLSASLVGVIYGFSRRLFSGPNSGELAAYSALLSILAPNLIMLSLFLDQALYPPLFLLMAGEILLAMRRQAWAVCFGIGAVLYGVIFLSFSMLPLLAIPVFYFAAIQWQNARPKDLWPAFRRTLLPMGLGGGFAMLLFKLFFQYDIFTRYQRMMETRIEGDFYTRLGLQSAGEVTLLQRLQQTWDAAVLNNVEMAVAIGLPVCLFFIVAGVQSVIRVLRRTPDEAAAVNASLFLSYAALIALRVVLGEVARLWMFWIPVMTILTVQFLLPVIRRNRWFMAGLIIMQLITIFLTYQFQDYLMPQLLP